jgi:hypothetical protein
MSNTKNNNVRAFPLAMPCSPDERGMTMRDYFAAKAMPIAMKQALSAITDEDSASAMELVPRLSYAMADAMLKARVLLPSDAE